MQPPPTNEERVLAALVHASIIANGANFLGIIGTALIWATQRERSPYVAAHALQAMVFQATGLLLTLLLSCGWGGCLLVSLLPAIVRPELYRTSPPALFWLALLIGVVILVFVLVGVAYGLVGAWAAWRGQPFHYALVGQLVTRPSTAPSAAVSTTPPAAPTSLLTVPPTTDKLDEE